MAELSADVRGAIGRFCRGKRKRAVVQAETKTRLKTLRAARGEAHEGMAQHLDDLGVNCVRLDADRYLRRIVRRSQRGLKPEMVINALGAVTRADVHTVISKAPRSKSRNRPITIVDAVVEAALAHLAALRTETKPAVQILKKCPRGTCMAMLPHASPDCKAFCDTYEAKHHALQECLATRKTEYAELDAQFEMPESHRVVEEHMAATRTKARRITLHDHDGPPEDHMLRWCPPKARKGPLSVGHVRETLRVRIGAVVSRDTNIPLAGAPVGSLNAKIDTILRERTRLIPVLVETLEAARDRPGEARVVLQRMRGEPVGDEEPPSGEEDTE